MGSGAGARPPSPMGHHHHHAMPSSCVRTLPLAPPTPPCPRPCSFMPATMVGLPDLATALGAFRMCLALSLARQPGPFAAVSDPVLAAFPGILADHHVLREFLTKWRDMEHKMTAILDVSEHACRQQRQPIAHPHPTPPRPAGQRSGVLHRIPYTVACAQHEPMWAVGWRATHHLPKPDLQPTAPSLSPPPIHPPYPPPSPPLPPPPPSCVYAASWVLARLRRGAAAPR